MTSVHSQVRERASDLEERLGLSPEVAGDFDERAEASRPNFGYYRMANGYITVDQVSEMEELHYRREGWEPLSEYGNFDMTTEYTANHPFELLFMKGGSVEMPLAQVIENGFHIRTPTVPGCLRPIDQHHKKHNAVCIRRSRTVLFPQLDGSSAQPWPCEYCEHVSATRPGARQHMSVMHKDELGQISTGNALSAAIVRGLSEAGMSGAVPEAGPVAPVDVSAEAMLNAIAQIGLTPEQAAALANMGRQGPVGGPDALEV